MSNTSNTTKDWRDETDAVARRLAGLVRHLAIKMTQGSTWQAIGHILLDGNEETADVRVFSGVGFYARPAADANVEAIVAFPGGPSNPVVVASQDEALRKKMAGSANQDETFIFNSQVVLRLSNSGLVQAFLLGGPVPVPLALKSDVDGAITAHNGHTHTDPQGGVTGPPNTPAPASVGSSVLRG
jgi:hypothetical protein